MYREVDIMKFKKGFTIMEMVIVVAIISILSAVALSVYVLSAEESRMAEAEMWMGTVLLSQQRHRMSTGGRYARYWPKLDIAKRGQEQAKYATTNTLCTQDKVQPADGNCVKSGYKATLYGVTSPDSGIVVQRVNGGKYSYKLAQFYSNDQKKIYCAAGELYPERDKQVCVTFLGVDEYDPTAEQIVARIEQADPLDDDY